MLTDINNFEYDPIEPADLYYEDSFMGEIIIAARTLKFSQHGCKIINEYIKNISESELICTILKDSSKSSIIKFNIHCENFIAKMTWNEIDTKWKYTKQIVD